MNVKLRYLKLSDLDDLIQVENDERYWYLSGITKTFTRDELSNYIQNAKEPIETFGQLRYVIEVDNEFSGLIDLYEFDSPTKSAGIGIIILDEYQKKGIARKSLKLLIDYCKNQLSIKSLFARIEIDNLNSIKLFEKCGFQEKAFLNHYLKKNNRMVDCKEYLLLF